MKTTKTGRSTRNSGAKKTHKRRSSPNRAGRTYYARKTATGELFQFKHHSARQVALEKEGLVTLGALDFRNAIMDTRPTPQVTYRDEDGPEELDGAATDTTPASASPAIGALPSGITVKALAKALLEEMLPHLKATAAQAAAPGANRDAPSH